MNRSAAPAILDTKVMKFDGAKFQGGSAAMPLGGIALLAVDVPVVTGEVPPGPNHVTTCPARLILRSSLSHRLPRRAGD